MSSTIPVYIRFGDIPEDKQSKVHRSDEIIRAEGGVSVWEMCTRRLVILSNTSRKS